MSRRLLGDRPEIVSHDIVTRAMHAAGTSDFGGVAWTEPLEVLTRSLDRDARLTGPARRRVRAELVSLLTARVGAPLRDRGPTVFVLGLDGSGADQLAARLRTADASPAPSEPGPALPGGTTPGMESTFASLSFEERWHLPSYAEWLAEADLTSAYADLAAWRPRVVTGLGHLERLADISATLDAPTVVQVHCDVAAGLRLLVNRVVAERRRDCHDVDPAKVMRYWEWRVGLLLERNRAQRDALAATSSLIDVSEEQLRDDPDAVVALVNSSRR